MCLTHPETTHTPVCGKSIFHKTGPWCQKHWGLLRQRHSLLTGSCIFSYKSGICFSFIQIRAYFSHFSVFFFGTGYHIQAYLRGISGSVPDYLNKVNIAIKSQVSHISPSVYSSYVQTILYCGLLIACLKKECIYLNGKVLYC